MELARCGLVIAIGSLTAAALAAEPTRVRDLAGLKMYDFESPAVPASLANGGIAQVATTVRFIVTPPQQEGALQLTLPVTSDSGQVSHQTIGLMIQVLDGTEGEFADYTASLPWVAAGVRVSSGVPTFSWETADGEVTTTDVIVEEVAEEDATVADRPPPGFGGNPFTTPGVRCYQISLGFGAAGSCRVDLCFNTFPDRNDNSGVCYRVDLDLCGWSFGPTPPICPPVTHTATGGGRERVLEVMSLLSEAGNSIPAAMKEAIDFILRHEGSSK